MPPLIKLESLAGDETTEILQIESGLLTIGREPENGIVLDAEAVSRRHACIFEAGSQWIFQDLASTNGSWLNGAQCKGNQLYLIRHGDILKLANFLIRVCEVNRELGSGEQVNGHGDDHSKTSEPCFPVFLDDRFEGEFTLNQSFARCVIGGEDADLRIEGAHGKVAEIVLLSTGRIEIHIGQSSTPIMVNGVSARGTTTVVDRDEIVAGPFHILVADLKSSDPKKAERALSAGKGKAERVGIYAGTGAGAPHQSTYGEQWEPSVAKSKSSSSYIFGQSGEGDMQATVSAPAYRGRPHTGFETNSSLRFSGVLEDEEDQDGGGGFQRLLIILMAVLVFLVIVAVVFIVV